MALTYAFKQSVKGRKRSSRRLEVVLFGVFMAMGLAEGSEPLGRHNFGLRMLLFIPVLTRIYKQWQWQRMVKVSSLDDRAMFEYGVKFEALSEAEQKELLRRYRVGTYVMGYYPDEREETAERESNVGAYAILRWLLPMVAIVYWAGWRLIPEGTVRACWTNGPNVLAWLFLLVLALPRLLRLVLALPRLLRLWTEPDEVGEPRVVASADA